ncbi:MAG: SMP-30/gluconolactonase/LRE family protein [Ferruginibacter sp.]
MKQNLLLRVLFAAAILFGCQSRQAKTNVTEQKESKLKMEIIDPEALTILDSAATIEVLAGGFKWTEGPLYISDGDYFIFSDIPDNKVYKWKEGQDTSTYLIPSGNTGAVKKIKEPGSNGLVLSPDGHLVLCQHGDRRIAKMIAPLNTPGPVFVTLADKYKGKRLNSPNDAVYHPNGDLYFTDPPYGLGKGIQDSTKELDFQGVYRLKPNGQLDLFTKDLKYPNGIALSPDNKFLYVSSSDSTNYLWMQYELGTDGMAKSQRIFYEVHAYQGKNLGAPDGMKINKKGYIFATGPEGVWLFNPGGKLIARIYTGQLTSNCAFSPGELSLYMTCDRYIMRLKLKK